MMAVPSQHQVNRLSTIAFHSVVKESFRRSGPYEAMVEYVYAFLIALRAKSDIVLQNWSIFKRRALFEANNHLIRKILQMDELPRHLVIELANCMIEYQKSIVQFANFIASSLTWITIDKVRALCECIAVRPDGVLDKQRTILKAVGHPKLFDYSAEFMASFFCVSSASAVQEYERRAAEGIHYPYLSCYENLSNPLQTWQAKQAAARMEELFYECVAIKGPREALEYFYYAADPSIRQMELSKAASCIEHHEISADKILFFRKHMKPRAWRTVLKRCFYKIFCTILENHRYKHMCVTLYREVREDLGNKIIFSCIDAMNTHISESYWCPLRMELLLADIEPIFTSLWQLIPVAHRQSSGNTIFNIFQTFLIYRKADALAVLIKDNEAFTTAYRNQLTGCTAIELLVNEEPDSVLDFVNKISSETYDLDRLKNELFTLDNLITYIAFVDRCCHISTYDRLLSFKYTQFSIEIAKKYLIFRSDVNHVILQALRQGFVRVTQFEAFLHWIFNEHSSHLNQYVKSCQKPPNLLSEIYKYYITSSRRSMYTIPAFQQSDEESQKIRRQIATDHDTLYAYCYTLMLTKDYSALPRMLTSVFAHEREREQFLSGFFLSKLGLDSFYRMLMSPAYDNTYFVRFVLKNKLNEFLEFRKHWIITPGIRTVLELVMNGYGRDQVVREECNARELMEEIKLDILPHESVEEFSRVCEVNIAIFKCVLRNSFVVDIFHALSHLL